MNKLAYRKQDEMDRTVENVNVCRSYCLCITCRLTNFQDLFLSSFFQEDSMNFSEGDCAADCHQTCSVSTCRFFDEVDSQIE